MMKGTTGVSTMKVLPKHKVNNKFKPVSEIENIRLEDNCLILEGFALVREITNDKLKDIQFVLVNSFNPNKSLIIDNYERLIRKDVSFIYGKAGKLNYDYSGFRLKLNVNEVTEVTKKYREYDLYVRIFISKNRSYFFPIKKVHSTLEKLQYPSLAGLQVQKSGTIKIVLNKEKSQSKAIEEFKHAMYLKLKSLYGRIPKRYRRKSLRNLLVNSKERLLG